MSTEEEYSQYCEIAVKDGWCPFSFSYWKENVAQVEPANAAKFPHYFPKLPSRVAYLDVYRVIKMFQVTDPALQHAVKKVLCAGLRGAKDLRKDIVEAKESLERCLEMLDEESKEI